MTFLIAGFSWCGRCISVTAKHEASKIHTNVSQLWAHKVGWQLLTWMEQHNYWVSIKQSVTWSSSTAQTIVQIVLLLKSFFLAERKKERSRRRCTSDGVFVPSIYSHARWEFPSATQVFVAVFRDVFQALINSLVFWVGRRRKWGGGNCLCTLKSPPTPKITDSTLLCW